MTFLTEILQINVPCEKSINLEKIGTYGIAVCHVNQKTVLDSSLVIEGALQNQLASAGNRKTFQIFCCTDEPKFEVLKIQ